MLAKNPTTALVCVSLNKIQRFTVMCLSCHQNGKYGNFTLLFCRGRHGLVHKCMRAARAARLFLLTRPIKFLISGVVVAVPVVDAKASHFFHKDDNTS